MSLCSCLDANWALSLHLSVSLNEKVERAARIQPGLILIHWRESRCCSGFVIEYSHILLVTVVEPSAVCRTSHRICGAQCRMKTQGPLFKNYWEFQDSNRALNPSAWPSVQSPMRLDRLHTHVTGHAVCAPLRIYIIHIRIFVVSIWAQFSGIAICVLFTFLQY